MACFLLLQDDIYMEMSIADKNNNEQSSTKKKRVSRKKKSDSVESVVKKSKTTKRKGRKKKVEEFNPLFLPSSNIELEKYIGENKVKLMDGVISSIEYATKNELPMTEVFYFDKSEYVITVSKHQFKKNVEKIYQFYIDNEYYELCPRVLQLINTLDEE